MVFSKISFSKCLLLVYYVPSVASILCVGLVSMTLLNLFFSFNKFFRCFRHFHVHIHVFCGWKQFYCFLILFIFYFIFLPFCILGPPVQYRMEMVRMDLFPSLILGRKAFIISSLSMVFVIGSEYIGFVRFSLFFVCWFFKNNKWKKFYKCFFVTYLGDHIISPFIWLMWWITFWFLNIEPDFHSWNKLHLVMIYYPFYILPDLIF